MNHEYLKESCVESIFEAVAAEKNGADLIELCSHLDFDGLTPEKNVIKYLNSELTIPIKVMIRPRKGNFEYSDKEWDEIKHQIDFCLSLGIYHIVFGAIKDGRLDIDMIHEISEIDQRIKLTVHKAIDNSNHVLDDIIKLKDIQNVESILSSGQKKTAIEGVHNLLEMKAICGQQINLIPAGSITSENVDELHAKLGLKHYHGRKIVSLK